MTKRPEIMCWLSDARGIYIPRDFAKSFADRAKSVANVTDEQWAILEDPDDENYWEVWSEVCDSAIVTDDHGNKYRIHHDGDCWLVPVDMEWSDETEWFEWPSDDESEKDVYVCVDCGFYLANGMPDESDPEWSPEKIEAHWPSDQWHLVNGDSEKDHDFSWSPCEGCGTRLGGYRYHCTAWEDKAERNKEAE